MELKSPPLKLSAIDVSRVAYRFWTRTVRKGVCTEWLGSLDSDGYGKFSINRTSFRAHRVAYYLFYGIDPDDLMVRHRCDNPRCVNPRHLLLGTQRENIADMDSRNRRGRTFQQGEQSGRAILSEDDVRDIRASDKSHADLAQQYGVSRGCIQHAKSGLNWKHLT